MKTKRKSKAECASLWNESVIQLLREKGYPVDSYAFVPGEFDPPENYYVIADEFPDIPEEGVTICWRITNDVLFVYDRSSQHWTKIEDPEQLAFGLFLSDLRLALNDQGRVIGKFVDKTPKSISAAPPIKARPISDVIKEVSRSLKDI